MTPPSEPNANDGAHPAKTQASAHDGLRRAIGGALLALLFVHAMGAVSPCFIAQGACGSRHSYLGLIVLQVPILLASAVVLSFGSSKSKTSIYMWKFVLILVVLWGPFSVWWILQGAAFKSPFISRIPEIYILFVIIDIISMVVLPLFLWQSRKNALRDTRRAFCIVTGVAVSVWFVASTVTWLRIEQRASVLAGGPYQLLIPVYRRCDYVPIQTGSAFWLLQYSLAYEPYDRPVNPYHLVLLPAGAALGDENSYHWSFDWMDFVKGTSVLC